MKLRVLFEIPIVLLAMFAVSLVAAPSLHLPLHHLALAAPPDNDGDTLLDEYDPDDDNDGVPDAADPEPFNPAVPGDAAPGEPDSGQSPPDNDGDTLLDDYDPDDDNDGVADADDPDPSKPQVPLAETPSATHPPVIDTPSLPEIAADSVSEPVPVVTSLPSTGSGIQSSGHTGEAVGSLIVGVIGAISVHVRAIRRA